jgi:hypothetical protein
VVALRSEEIVSETRLLRYLLRPDHGPAKWDPAAHSRNSCGE